MRFYVDDPLNADWPKRTPDTYAALGMSLVASACEAHGEFACTSRACAPPPVGRGGSMPSGSRKFSPRNGANPEPYAQRLIAESTDYADSEYIQETESEWRRRMPKNPVVRVRVPLEALEGIARSGRLKTQHETGESQGTYHPELRDENERRMFGDGLKGRPIYGYVAKAGSTTTFSEILTKGKYWYGWEKSELGQYGDVVIELKPDVHSRVTVTMGDSFETDAAAIPLVDVWNVTPRRRQVSMSWNSERYIEAQIHQRVLVERDIARIYVSNNSEYLDDNPLALRLRQMFPDIEVVELPWKVAAEFSACNEHGEFACTSRSCAPPPVGTGGSLPSGVGDLARAALAGGRDGMVARMYAARGFDAKPTVVSAAQLSHLVRQGKVREAWRGISTAGGESSVPESVARAYIDDRRHPVVGGFAGSGTYVAFGKGGERESREYAGRGGAVLRIGIPPKMGSEPDLREIAEVVHRLTRKGEGVSLFDRRNIAKGAKVYKSLRDAGIDDEGIRELASDAAVIGMLMGWDGAYVSTGDGGVGYAVVWNRGATYVADEVLTASVTVGFIDGALVAACDLHGEFACTSRACAPPPVGTGGSLPSGGGISTSERGRSPLPKGATRTEAREFVSTQRSGGAIADMVARSLGGTVDTVSVENNEVRVQAKIQSNERIIERATKNPQFQKGLKRLLDSPIDIGRVTAVVGRDIRGDLVSDLVSEASRRGQGMTRGMPAWNLVEQGTTVRQFLERLSAGEFTEMYANNSLRGLSPETIATSILVRQFVDGWAFTSNDSDPRSISKQMAAAEMHGIDHEKFYREEYLHRGMRVDEEVLADARRQLEESRDILEGLTQSEYDATQEMLREAGIDKVVLYRGFSVKPGTEPSQGDVISTGSNPLSSWTTNFRTAGDFAPTGDVRIGVVTAMEVPIEMIQSTTVTGRGCLHEHEVIVIGYPSEALVVNNVAFMREQ